MNTQHVMLGKLRDALFRSAPAAPHLLVVDDDEAVCRFVARVLSEAGYVVETAHSGSEALAAVGHGAKFDLVVSDVHMPSMSGPLFIEQLRRSEADLKVLYLTGYCDQLFDERGALWADEAFLDKPCTVQGLLESVALMLYGHLAPPASSRKH
jgi:two-component system, cell cycle sensor histidine kinase and response regulator CckA